MSVIRNFTPPAGEDYWPHVSRWGDEHWSHWLTQQGWTPEAIQGYLGERFAYGLGVRKGDEAIWLYTPTPRQVEFHKARATNVLYGGAAGGAKSHALRWEAYRRCLTVPGYRALLFRRTFAELLDNHIDEAIREVERMKEAGVAVGYVKDEKRVTFRHPTGPDSWVRFAHCENEGDEEKYLSSQYELLMLDELATFTQKQALGILSRSRSPLEGVTPVARCSSNPGGAHTLWVLDWFMGKTVTSEQDPYYDPADWAFLPSKLYDNPWLMDPDGSFRRYEKRLGGLGPERRRQLLDGDWTAITGAFFSEWREADHVRDIGIPQHVEYFGSMDFGWNSPGCFLLWAALPDGHFHVVRDWKFRLMTADQVANKIKAMCQQLGIPRLRYVACDPAMNQKTGAGRGESILETLRRRGLNVTQSDNDPYNGAMRCHQLLAPAPDVVPWCTFDPSCGYLRRTIPALVSDDKDPDRVDTTGDDHGYDAWRYGAMSRPSPTTIAEEKSYPIGSMGWWEEYDARQQRGTGVLA